MNTIIQQNQEKKKIVILGAGFGGLRAAAQIGKAIMAHKLEDKYEVVIVERNDHHTYTPLLYEVATTLADTVTAPRLHEVATFNIKSIFARLSVTPLRDNIMGIDLEKSVIQLELGGALIFDHLIITLGSETNDFGIPGLHEHSLPLKTFGDAIRIRDRIADLMTSGEKDVDQIKILVGGAGSTGVEIAGELKMLGFSVELIEATPGILPGFDERVRSKVMRRLAKIGVMISTGQSIKEVSKHTLALASGEIKPFDLFVWTGGIKPSSLIQTMPIKTELHKRAEITGEMCATPISPDLMLRSHIYVLGDAACFMDPKTGKAIPSVARAAIDEADIASWNLVQEILAELKAAPAPTYRHYVPQEYPYIIPIGGKYAIAKVGSIIISGFFGWVLKGFVELNYILSLMPLRKALKIWLKGLWIFVQNDRLG